MSCLKLKLETLKITQPTQCFQAIFLPFIITTVPVLIMGSPLTIILTKLLTSDLTFSYLWKNIYLQRQYLIIHWLHGRGSLKGNFIKLTVVDWSHFYLLPFFLQNVNIKMDLSNQSHCLAACMSIYETCPYLLHYTIYIHVNKSAYARSVFSLPVYHME